MRWIATTLLFSLALGTAAEAHEARFGALRISHPWCKIVGDGLAAAVTINNTGPTADRLLGISTSLAAEGPALPPGGVVIPAGAVVRLKQLPFQAVAADGMVVGGMLIFEKAGALPVEFEIAE